LANAVPSDTFKLPKVILLTLKGMIVFMVNLQGRIELVIAQLYSLRMDEYGFKQVKMNWMADFRLTDYASIERWWEIVYSAYLLVSMGDLFKKATVHKTIFETTAIPEFTNG